MSKELTRKILVVLIAILGVGLVIYPLFSQYLFSRNASTAAQDYHEVISETGNQELEQVFQDAVKYNENLEGNPVHDPFLENSGMVMADNYYSVLKLGRKGEMGHISIPKIDVRSPLYHGTSDLTLQKGVGHLEGSSLPVGGRGTHSVLTGHTGLSHARMFTDLEKLVEGDIFYYHILNQTLAYKVDSITVVEPHDTSLLQRDADNDYTTLITCTPYGINTHRLLVRAARIEYDPVVQKQLIEEGKNPWGWLSFREIWIGIAAGLGLVATALVILMWRRRYNAFELASSDLTNGGGKPWQRTQKLDGGMMTPQAEERYWWHTDASR